MEQNRQANTTDKPNDSKPLVSVIVPVYKTPVEFLSRCIQSITNQTYLSLYMELEVNIDITQV